MFYLLARHIHDDDWYIAVADIASIEEAIEAMRIETTEDTAAEWDYKIVKDV